MEPQGVPQILHASWSPCPHLCPFSGEITLLETEPKNNSTAEGFYFLNGLYQHRCHQHLTMDSEVPAYMTLGDVRSPPWRLRGPGPLLLSCPIRRMQRIQVSPWTSWRGFITFGRDQLPIFLGLLAPRNSPRVLRRTRLLTLVHPGAICSQRSSLGDDSLDNGEIKSF